MIPHAELIKAIGVTSKSNLSNILGKKQNIQPAAWEKFRKLFGISEQPNGQLRESNLLTGAHVTLQDHIDLIKDYNNRLYHLLNSSLGKMNEKQLMAIAYQKAWVDYEAERAAAGDQNKKAEIMNKMNKSVLDILTKDSLSDIQNESGI